MTLIEVMVAVLILTVGIGGVMSSIANLAQARNTAIQRSQVQMVATVMLERLQGAAWTELTQNWAKPRFVGDATTTPLTEGGAAADNLQSLGILAGPSGVPDLKVYVEYYQMALMSQNYTTRAQWLDALPDNKLPLGAATLNTVDLVFRVVVTGCETNGQPTIQQELFSARKY